ncbi:MAG TPA: DUF624 domain-containing protein [Microbacterium sp.]|nr:DUF624 domain-containing protein [Microbacterium sp.]
MSSGTLRETVTNRLQQGFDAVYWMLIVNVLVIVFTLAGGIVLGAAPAIIAGTELTRRRADGRLFPVLRTFARVWRAEFWRANGLLMPFGVAAGILVIDIAWFRANGPLGTAGILAIAALVIVATLGSLTAGLYVNYEMPFRAYIVRAARWSLGNLPHVLLLGLTLVLFCGATYALPGLLPFLTIGGLVVVPARLCTAFFRSNERLLAEQP